MCSVQNCQTTSFWVWCPIFFQAHFHCKPLHPMICLKVKTGFWVWWPRPWGCEPLRIIIFFQKNRPILDNLWLMSHICPLKVPGKVMFLFPRWDMLVLRRVPLKTWDPLFSHGVCLVSLPRHRNRDRDTGRGRQVETRICMGICVTPFFGGS